MHNIFVLVITPFFYVNNVVVFDMTFMSVVENSSDTRHVQDLPVEHHTSCMVSAPMTVLDL